MNITVGGLQISQHPSGQFIGFDGVLYDTPEQAAATTRPARHRRSAIKSPRHKLLSAEPFQQIAGGPTQVAYIPKQLSYWDNNIDGDCVTASEAFRKACANPEIFIKDQTVVSWARQHGFLNGANLTDVMDQMAKGGFSQDGHVYGDGPYKSVDYSNEAAIQSALCNVGPVNIAIDANALPSGAGNKNGWYAVGGRPGQFPNTDHCVDWCAGGVACTAAWFYAQLRVPVPSGLDPNKVGYGLFTWNTIGFVDYQWGMSTVVEAWVCDPCTTVDGKAIPNPAPSPTPPPTNSVPNVIGESWTSAKMKIVSAGYNILPASVNDQTLSVVGESPIAGTALVSGGTVTVILSTTPVPPTNITLVSPSGDQLPLPTNWTVLGGGGGIPPQLVADIQAATIAEAAATTALQQSDAAWAKVSADVSQLPKPRGAPMNKAFLALLLAGGFLAGNVSPTPETNGVAQSATQNQMTQSETKIVKQVVPPGCDCAACDCPVCDGTNCGPLIKQTVRPDAKFTPQPQLSYDEAYIQAMKTGSILAVYKGPWAYSQLKNIASCYVSSADQRFAEYPERCIIVSRAEIGGDGLMHLNYVAIVVDGKPESLARAFTLPTPTYPSASTPQVTVRAPIGHTHTCPRCGTTWDHSTNPSHICPNCGVAQYVQDSSPRMVTTTQPAVRQQPIQLQSSTSGGCANGSCGTSQRLGLFR